MVVRVKAAENNLVFSVSFKDALRHLFTNLYHPVLGTQLSLHQMMWLSVDQGGGGTPYGFNKHFPNDD